MFPLLPLLYLTSWSVTPYGYFAHWEWPHLVPLFLYWFRFPSKDKRFSLFMVVMPIELPQIINHRTYEKTSLGFHKPWTLPTIDQHLILFHVYFCLKTPYSSLVAQWVKTLPTMQETWIWFLGWEDLLEKGKATHSVFLLGEFCGQRSLAGPWVCKESEDSVTFTFACFLHLFLYLYLKKMIHIYMYSKWTIQEYECRLVQWSLKSRSITY